MKTESFKGVLLLTLVIASVVVLALSFSSSGSASEPSNQSPIADFNFFPEHPREGANVYFFDSSEDPDGCIVERYWYYSLWFGGGPTLPMPFEEGEQNKPNPTLTFEFGGSYPEEVMIGLRVTDDDGAVNDVTRIIQTDMSPPFPSEPPIADFNFFPEQPTAGEEVYFSDSSGDPDGYIVEWYWYYSLNFGDNYWTCFMPFGNGEPNPTLTLDYYAEEAQITLVVTDIDGATDSVSRIIQILDPVQVLISPTYQEGVPGATLTYTVTVTNTGNVYDNYDLTVSDNENWGPTLSETLLDNVGPGENRVITLSVTIPENATSFDQDNIWVTATSVENAEVTDSEVCIAQVPGKAIFGLVNLSKISLDADLYLGQGSKLVVKFYTWGGDYQGGTVVWSGTTPDHVILLDNILHPLQPLVWVVVEKVVLVLTDAEGTTISTLSTFIVRKIDLEIRFVKIVSEWFLAPPEKRIMLETEFSRIPSAWFLAPS